MDPLTAWAFLLKHWRVLALGVVLLGLTGWHFEDKISDWWDDRKIHNLEAKVEAQAGKIAALEKVNRDAEASANAAQAARSRNDEVIPESRRAAAERAQRASTADRVQRVRDVSDALGAYGAAANQL